MHLQIRCVPAASPADLKAFLQVLADNDVNIIAAGGSNVESGGEFAFAVDDEDPDEVKRVTALLTAKGYSPRVVDVHYCWLTNEPGQLLSCVTEATVKNADRGVVIRDVSIGVPGADGRILVQIYSDVPWR
jgi:hypothetical protein